MKDESLQSSTVHIIRNQTNTCLDKENPCVTVIVGLEPIVVAGDHSIWIIEKETFHIVVIVFLE
jgi:tRNA(Ile2) C34 agmatinyltransferase TiaS